MSPIPAVTSLGSALCDRFLLSAQQIDLVESFEFLSLTVKANSEEPEYLLDFGEYLFYRYNALGRIDDLHESLAFLNRAHDLRMGHRSRGKICRVRAAAMIRKDQHLGNRMDFCLEILIEHYKESLIWQPVGHHSHFEGWNGLGMVYHMQFVNTSNIHFLNRAILYNKGIRFRVRSLIG
jgi:hypothetical protein